jgi:L-threonylcarbamoyladenylate synthase
LTGDVEQAVATLRGGGLAVIPTDTVYGLACLPQDETAVRELYALKGRGATQPTALVAATVEALLDCVPELAGREAVLRALLPGGLTLVLPNPERRLAWLAGERPATIGVRVPRLDGPGAEVLDAVGVVAATSANHAGGVDPRRLDEVPPEIRAAAACIDGGELPGLPSTVVDLTGGEPVVLREGAVPTAVVMARVAEAQAG